MTLLITVLVVVGNQIFYLMLITMNVVYSRDYLMECNPNTVGYPTATLCEWTKAHVRCFPILGLKVSALVTSRMLLQHRVYYQMLKRGALVDFEDFSPFNDPLFWVLITDLLLALLHFVFLIWHLTGLSVATVEAKDLANPKFLEDASQTAAFYVVPAVVFLSFLYKAYDTEQSLLPLSKYFDEDPEAARANLSRMKMLPEAKCAQVLSSDFWGRLEAVHSKGDLGIDEDVVFAAFIEKAAEDYTEDDEEVEALSRWRLVSTLWPAKLLLTHRIKGVEAQRFQLAWSGFSAFSFFIIMLTLAWLCRATLMKFEDVMNGQGSTDWAGLLVFFAHLGLWAFLAKGFVANMLTQSLNQSVSSLSHHAASGSPSN